VALCDVVDGLLAGRRELSHGRAQSI
jgi:hypothetical protein